MDQKILETLEYGKVKSLFADYLVTAQGKEFLRALLPIENAEKIQEIFAELEVFSAILRQNGDLKLSETKEVSESLKRLEINADLALEEFLALKEVIQVLVKIDGYFEGIEGREKRGLAPMLGKISSLSNLTKLFSVFDDEGKLQDSASDELFRIRQTLRKEASHLRGLMQKALNQYSSSLSENLVSFRNGRQVLPVKLADKHKVAGVVRDVSSSGQTLYIEPDSVLSTNELLTQLQIEEKSEVQRIFKRLSQELKILTPAMKQGVWVVGQIDLLRAKHKFMLKENASIPVIKFDGSINLVGARHPLIPVRTAVLNNFDFAVSLKTVVITGSNTGGKTIALKMAGILCLLAQSGLPITAKRGSSLSIFKNIYADIGDEQSIEQNLSTFSGHMQRIIALLEVVDKRSLVLLDELGAGTDPKEGAALAVAILEELRKKGGKTVATTHYPELKAYGLETPGVSNASMIFDLEKLIPTYIFNLGTPGRSNAFEISKRLGLSRRLIQTAKNLLTGEERDVNSLISNLEEKNYELEQRLLHAQKLESENKKLQHKLEVENKKIEREERKRLDQAEEAAHARIAEAKEEVRSLLKKLNDTQNLKPHQLIAAMAELDDKLAVPDLSKNKVLKKAKSMRGLESGSQVFITRLAQRGELVKIEKDGRWEVKVGSAIIRLEEEEFELVPGVKEAKARNATIKRKPPSHLSAQLDLRGTRYEEAALEIDNYIDRALLANLNQITIVHGIGTGVIRGLVQEKLSKNKHIQSFEFAPMGAGGSGATIALLK